MALLGMECEGGGETGGGVGCPPLLYLAPQTGAFVLAYLTM